jgi:hypothetical protein
MLTYLGNATGRRAADPTTGRRCHLFTSTCSISSAAAAARIQNIPHSLFSISLVAGSKDIAAVGCWMTSRLRRTRRILCEHQTECENCRNNYIDVVSQLISRDFSILQLHYYQAHEMLLFSPSSEPHCDFVSMLLRKTTVLYVRCHF